jgi:hypothetical protein
MSFPDPDEDDVARFVGLMFPRATPGGWVLQRLFEEGTHRTYCPNAWRAVRREENGLGDIVENACELIRIAATADRPVLFASPVCTFQTPDNAKESNIADAPVLAVEIDAQPRASWGKLADTFGPCTAVVASGSTRKPARSRRGFIATGASARRPAALLSL